VTRRDGVAVVRTNTGPAAYVMLEAYERGFVVVV
jgi:hypothetical protein